MRTFKNMLLIVLVIFLAVSCAEQKKEVPTDKKIENKIEQKNEIFTVEKADELFGKVLFSQEMNLSDFQNFLAMADDKMMFKFVNNKIMMLDGTRKNLTNEGLVVDEKEVFSVAEKKMIEELISKSKADKIIFEQRKDVFSIKFGNFVLERTWPCPPFC